MAEGPRSVLGVWDGGPVISDFEYLVEPVPACVHWQSTCGCAKQSLFSACPVRRVLYYVFSNEHDGIRRKLFRHKMQIPLSRHRAQPESLKGDPI